MASKYTARFGLNEWAAEDPVLREDFNRDNALLEDALDKLSFIIGSYSGTGSSNTQTFELGFVPKLLIVLPRWGSGAPSFNGAGIVALTPELNSAGDRESVFITLSGSAFTVTRAMNNKAGDGTYYTENVNPYRYIAWRQI